MEGLSGSLRIKGAPLATAWQHITYSPNADLPASLGKIHALFLTRCRQEARNRNLALLRPDQATNIGPSWMVQGATQGLAKSH